MSTLTVMERPAATLLGDTPAEFLRALPGPTIVYLSGKSSARRRAVTVMLHGNEPSGLVALHRWLRSGAQPAVDTVCFIGAVEAARSEPLFSRRMLPGRRDLNRCFVGPTNDRDGQIAAAALTHMRDVQPELAIDLHNNSGRNPSYGVVAAIDDAHRALVGLFTIRCIVTEIRLGTLIEALDPVCPTVTIECGRAGDPDADEVAFRGLARFLERDRIDVHRPPEALEIYRCTRRIRLREGAHLVFADRPDERADLTLRSDLDRYNFAGLEAGSPIGWVHGPDLPLEILDADGRAVRDHLFEVAGGRVTVSADILPCMMTSDEESAAADCLCYLVERVS